MTVAMTLCIIVGAVAVLLLLGAAAAVLALVDRPVRESWAPRIEVTDLQITSEPRAVESGGWGTVRADCLDRSQP